MGDLYFSEFFGVSQGSLAEYGACDVSLVSDLPFFVDPFLLFNSSKPEYQALHHGIIEYVLFLRDRADEGLSQADIDRWYRFKEVKQNWLGFTYLGNSGSGLGGDFAAALHMSFRSALRDFGQETVTRGSHVEKLALVKDHVGRDNISDLTTNLIKSYLLEYTERFAQQHLKPGQRRQVAVTRAEFRYDTGTWATGRYELPMVRDDFVLLTPLDMLTRDDTWISRGDMIRRFSFLPEALPDAQLRAAVNFYFASLLGKNPKQKDHDRAAASTLNKFPELIDYYIKDREDDGDRAESVSSQKRRETEAFLIDLVKHMRAEMDSRSQFLRLPATTYDECLTKANEFKHYIEDQDGYLLLNPYGSAQKPSRETDVQLFFGLLLRAGPFDVNREVNNGRGPVDFAVSQGRFDKTLIEMKLGSNSQLKRNLMNQVPIYQKASGAKRSVKVIVCYTGREMQKVDAILAELGLGNDESVVVIDARNDNKPSASKA